MTPLSPIVTLPLFPELNAGLVSLLESLTRDDWQRPTIHARRTVKDLAAHLLDGSLRRLSLQRDGHPVPRPNIQSYQDLVDFIQDLNAEWMKAAQRLSPLILVQLIKQFDQELYELLAGLDPDAEAIFSVAWAGEEVSRNWFDVAREYTEKWHHQQQIRDAVGKPGMKERKYIFPVLDAFARGIPHAYRNVAANESTIVKIVVTGDGGGEWFLVHTGSWTLFAEASGTPDAEVSLDQDIAWRLWTKGLDRVSASEKLQCRGDRRLALPVLDMVTVMA